MKVAIEYSGFLRFVQTTIPLLNTFFIADEPIEFYLFFHTWDTSFPEDIEYMKQHAHDYYIDSQKNFEVHPYQLIGVDMTHEEYKNDPKRHEWNRRYPNDIKHYFEKPSPENRFKFDKDLQVVRFGRYSHYPYNTLSLFYSMHQVSLITNHYSQKNNIDFDFVVRMRTDGKIEVPINLNHLNKNMITIYDTGPVDGRMEGFGHLTLHDQFAIGNKELMTKYNDLFVYLPAYYFIFKIDWISEFLLGFHLKYNNIPIKKISKHFSILRYSDRINPKIITRPVI